MVLYILKGNACILYVRVVKLIHVFSTNNVINHRTAALQYPNSCMSYRIALIVPLANSLLGARKDELARSWRYRKIYFIDLYVPINVFHILSSSAIKQLR